MITRSKSETLPMVVIGSHHSVGPIGRSGGIGGGGFRGGLGGGDAGAR
jgi:hypothetical protein